jgi:SnoaL-like domain
MSQENVETLRAVYAAIATGDFPMLFELCDPNVEVTEPPEIPDSSTYHGHDGIRTVFEKLQEVFQICDSRHLSSSLMATGCSPRCTGWEQALAAERVLGSRSFTFGASRMAAPLEYGLFLIAGKPSKPPDCGSRPPLI